MSRCTPQRTALVRRNCRCYRTSQRLRKQVEEIFGWMKTVGGLRRSRYCGVDRTQAWAYFVAGTYNLLRITNLGLSLQAR
jgi:IS5 family transposase